MRDLDEMFQFIIDALSANAAKGKGSVVSIRISPFNQKESKATTAQPITSDDVVDAHEALKHFDGDFRKLFSSRRV